MSTAFPKQFQQILKHMLGPLMILVLAAPLAEEVKHIILNHVQKSKLNIYLKATKLEE